MWGKRKLAVLLRREGIDVSVSMVGRILTKLMARGVVTPVPMLHREPGPRSHPSRVPLNHQPGDRPVSYGLNSDKVFTAHRCHIASTKRSTAVSSADTTVTWPIAGIGRPGRVLERQR